MKMLDLVFMIVIAAIAVPAAVRVNRTHNMREGSHGLWGVRFAQYRLAMMWSDVCFLSTATAGLTLMGIAAVMGRSMRTVGVAGFWMVVIGVIIAASLGVVASRIKKAASA